MMSYSEIIKAQYSLLEEKMISDYMCSFSEDDRAWFYDDLQEAVDNISKAISELRANGFTEDNVCKFLDFIDNLDSYKDAMRKHMEKMDL